MSENLTPCAEAVEAAFHAADVADAHGCGRRGIVDEAGAAALPHLRRQIIGECVGEVAAMRGTWEHVGTPDPFYQAALVAVEMRLRALLDAPTKEGDDG